MGERMDKRIRFYIYWILGFVLLGACAPGDKEDVYTEMRAFEDFFTKNWYKAQRKAKFYINKCRSASCMQGGLKQASA